LTTIDPLQSFFKRSWVFCTSKPITLLLLQNCNCANDVVVHDLHLSFLIASDCNQEFLVQNFVKLYYLFGAIFLKNKIVTKVIGCASLIICFFLMPSPNGATFFSHQPHWMPSIYVTNFYHKKSMIVWPNSPNK